MKNKLPLLILLLLCLSCNDRNDDRQNNGNNGNNENEENEEKDVIKVEAKSIRVWPYESEKYQILSDGNFTVVSSDPKVVQAYVENKTLVVTATGIGRATLRLMDGVHDDLPIQFSSVLAGLYTEEHTIEGLAPKIHVEGDNKEVADGILKDLTSDMSNYNNIHYSFEAYGRFWLDFRKDHTIPPYEGTFNWDGRTLVLNYADKIETYSFKGIKNGPRPYMFSIIIDLTDKYKAIYPDGGIQNVTVERFVTAIPPFGTEE